MSENKLLLVSVPVITYNSSKYVIETLESIKAQTYQNIELIVSDDCSTDNTVQLCKDWIEKNKSRFVRTVVIESPMNTGISANGNRAQDACQGEWVKEIAGDDLLLPGCIESCIDYVSSNPEVSYLFGRIECFGVDPQRCEEMNKGFDYSFFDLSNEKKLHRLLFDRNCIPASTCFYNLLKARGLNIKNDTRIPLLEDWPKWINVLRSGLELCFLDKILVKYRIGGISTSSVSVEYFRSLRMCFFYYTYPELLKRGDEYTIYKIVEFESRIFSENISLKNQLRRIRTSFPYKVYLHTIRPIRIFIEKKVCR